VLLKLSSPGTGGFWELPILFEDEHLLALNKPAGLLTVADSEDPARPNLVGLLHQAIVEAKPWAKERAISFLMQAYRLDPEASGVLLLARSKPMLTGLGDFFGAQRPSLSFITLVQGSPLKNRFSVEAKLAPHPARPGLARVHARHGKRSHTEFEVIESFAGWTLLKCAPLTHRPHQIRVHAAYAGFPLAGDPAYGGKLLLLSSLKPGFQLKPHHTERPLISSPCVHAEQLTLRHPATGGRLFINAPWPKDLEVAVKYLRKYSAP
jgi:RluA family pseudouridine synthase